MVLLNWPALRQWGFSGVTFHSPRSFMYRLHFWHVVSTKSTFLPGTIYSPLEETFMTVTRINSMLQRQVRPWLWSYFHTCFPAWYQFISSLPPPKLGLPYMFVGVQPSKEPVCNSSLGTKCYMISHLFTCVWYPTFLNFPNWLLCNFTLSLRCQ